MDHSSEKASDQKGIGELVKGVANELTLLFPELPSYRDMLIDRWSFDLAEAGSQTDRQYQWKRGYEFEMVNDDDYDDEEESKEGDK